MIANAPPTHNMIAVPANRRQESAPPLRVWMATVGSRPVIAPACLMMWTRLALLLPAVLTGGGAVAVLMARGTTGRCQKSYVLDRPRFAVMPVLGARSVSVAAFLVVAIGAAVRPGAVAAGIRTTIDGLGRTVVPGLGAGSVAVVRVGGAVRLITAVPTSGGRPRFAVAPVLGLGTVTACVATTTMRPAARVGASMPFTAMRFGFAGPMLLPA